MNKPLFIENNNYHIRDLIELYGKSLLNFAYTYVKDWNLAEDIIQEVFINVYRHGQLSEITSIKSWLYTITSNKCKDYLRKNYLKNDILVDMRKFFFKMANDQTPEKDVINTAQYHIISNFILNLPIKYREVIILFYYEDLSVKEISRLLGQKEATVRSKLHRGREMLRKTIDSDGGVSLE
jgi:RNA polymerase sigma-70 factor, ECF subfamily